MSAPKIAIIIESLWGHVAELAMDASEGAKKAGADVTLYQFEETLSSEALGKMHAYKAATDSLPVIKPDDLVNYDGFILAFPTRYGRAPAQVSSFFDHTGGLWAKGALVGKFGGIITSTGGQHGGMETTVLTTIPFFVHHGINFVPLGYRAKELNNLENIIGSSPYGAASIAGGDGSKRPSADDKSIATQQGSSFADIVGTFVRGKAAK